MGALRSLDLSGNSLSRDAFEALSRCHSLRHLRSLRLALTSLGADAMRALTRRASWPDLTSLELGDSERASESLPVLFESRLVERLTHLSLSASRLDASHLEPLVSALPRMRTLVGLDLSENPIGDVGAEALAAATMPPTLRRLSLHACALSSLGFERIAAAPWAEGLEAPFA
jgi:Ran GTPase-activating protein (RanGAP) involved in mRNA processing and transport